MVLFVLRKTLRRILLHHLHQLQQISRPFNPHCKLYIQCSEEEHGGLASKALPKEVDELFENRFETLL